MIEQLQRSQHKLSSQRLDEPIVLCAADDHYVRPLAVTLYSAARSLRNGSRLQVVVMDGGISAANWQGLRETLLDLPITVYRLQPDHQELSDLVTSHHITHTAYFRLLAARLIPDSIERVIYLDSDVLVRGDLTELWSCSPGDNYCLAVPDIACPFVDARRCDPQFRKSIPWLAALNPIPNWRQLGLDGQSAYFNSGVMVINLKRWREEKIEQRLLNCLRENAKFVWCWDQYALNVVFHQQWQPLPMHWNQGAHLFEYPDENSIPINTQEFRRMQDRPSLIHFTTEFKPWHANRFMPSNHPWRQAWFETLDQTAWRGWRPTPSPFSIQQWWTAQAIRGVRWGTVQSRRWFG